MEVGITLVPQLVKKVVQAGDTACLQPTLDVFSHEDRQLLQGHCHSRALSILRARPCGADSGAPTREAIAYLSLAIFAAGGASHLPQLHEDQGCEDHGVDKVGATLRRCLVPTWGVRHRVPPCTLPGVG